LAVKATAARVEPKTSTHKFMSLLPFGRRIKDALLTNDTSFPAAAASVASASIDLGQPASGRPPEECALQVEWPTMPALTDNTKTVLARLQDSADNAAFADVNPTIEFKIPGLAVTGPLADGLQCPLPPHIRRYVRLNITVPAGGGDNTALKLSLSVVS
jgi:hypothetical protein